MADNGLDADELRQIIAEVLDVDVTEVTDDARFVEDLGGDSLLALEIVVALEQRYLVRLTEADLRELTSIPKAYAVLAAKL
ncbi:MAG TPA: phosphopantetheine-binding protein [Micromonosporaceae bacterium]|nr:phosphopantetheine-binding protein [Micromonosporaceae bacterium]